MSTVAPFTQAQQQPAPQQQQHQIPQQAITAATAAAQQQAQAQAQAHAQAQLQAQFQAQQLARQRMLSLNQASMANQQAAMMAAGAGGPGPAPASDSGVVGGSVPPSPVGVGGHPMTPGLSGGGINMNMLTNAGAIPGVPAGHSLGSVGMNRLAMSQHMPRSLSGHAVVGNAVLKLLQYGEHLGAGPEKSDINFWRKFVSEYYTENGIMRLSLWNASLKEIKTFEITTTIVPKFYLNNFESGIRHMHLVLENAREYIMSNNSQYVDCPRASWVYNFENGCRVVSNGHLRVVFALTGKIELMEFITHSHTEYIAREAIVKTMTEPPDIKPVVKKGKSAPPQPQPYDQIKLPESPVNEYGITQKVMRCLEIAESVVSMRDLMSWSINQSQGPLESLRKYTEVIRNMPQPGTAQQQRPGPGMMLGPLPPSTPLGLQSPVTPGVGVNLDMNSMNSPASPMKRRLSTQGGPQNSPAPQTPNGEAAIPIKPSPSPRAQQRSPAQQRKK